MVAALEWLKLCNHDESKNKYYTVESVKINHNSVVRISPCPPLSNILHEAIVVHVRMNIIPLTPYVFVHLYLYATQWFHVSTYLPTCIYLART